MPQDEHVVGRQGNPLFRLFADESPERGGHLRGAECQPHGVPHILDFGRRFPLDEKR